MLYGNADNFYGSRNFSAPQISWRELVIQRGYLTVHNKLLVFSVSEMSIFYLYKYFYILSIEDKLTFINFNAILHIPVI